MVEEETGLKVDEPYLSNILSGNRTPPKVISAIEKLLGFNEEDEATEAALQEIRMS